MALSAMNSQNKFPVSSAEAAVVVKGNHTDIHCSVFADHIYIIVTQYCKIGSLVCVRPESVADEVGDLIPMFDTKIIFGQDQPLTHVMAKHIVMALKPSVRVLLALSLKDTTHDTLTAILPTIQSCVAQAQEHLDLRLMDANLPTVDAGVNFYYRPALETVFITKTIHSTTSESRSLLFTGCLSHEGDCNGASEAD
ncbi:proteasome assembly chaperone 3-like [Pomacea canaliculata]|uniref:proteasome assembly chaperone 3-like n=1 Tax=Pomacea canaliculata TaxID=400727 RepID=UPI000D73C100|nr:proteasome assembly chaperone 3-like [Pomacea canaliculata]